MGFEPIFYLRFSDFHYLEIGKRADNRLENLRWVTAEENITFMKMNRLGINQEITRLINKFGYEETLQLLRSL